MQRPERMFPAGRPGELVAAPSCPACERPGSAWLASVWPRLHVPPILETRPPRQCNP